MSRIEDYALLGDGRSAALVMPGSGARAGKQERRENGSWTADSGIETGPGTGPGDYRKPAVKLS